MTENELAGVIAERVMKILNERENQSSSRSDEPGKKRLLIMTGRCGSLGEEALKALNDKYMCTVQNREDAYAFALTARDFDLLLIAELSEGQLASAALGIPYGAEARPIVDALIAGHQVFILENGIMFRQNGCVSHELKKLYEEYLKKLYLFGAKPIREADIINIESTSEEPVQNVSSVHACPSLRVMTEEDAKKLLSKCEKCEKIIVSQKTIITPLAADFILHRGAVVERV